MISYLKRPFFVIGTVGQLCRKTKIKVLILRTNHTSRWQSNFVNHGAKDTGQRFKTEKTDVSQFSVFFTARCVWDNHKNVMSCQSTRKIVFNVDRKSLFFHGINTVSNTFFLVGIFRWFFTIVEFGKRLHLFLPLSSALIFLVGFVVPQSTSAR